MPNENAGANLLQIYYDERMAARMLPLVRQIHFGDALICPHGRLERIRPEMGFEHYLLYLHGQPVGVQYIRSKSWLDPVQRGLAGFLSVVGFTIHNTVLKMGDGQTPDDFEHNRLRHLFEMSVLIGQKG